MKKCILFLALVLGCNELPIGESEFDHRGNFDAQEVALKRFNSLTECDVNTFLGSSSNLVLGRNSDFESRVLLKFNFSDTTYEGLDEIKMILKRNSRFHKDTLAFCVYLLKGEFEEYKANWYQRQEGEGWQEPGGDYESDSLRHVTITGDSIVITFNYIELAMIQDAPGMILVPEDEGFVYFNSRQSGSAPQFILKKNENLTSVSALADCHILTGPAPFYAEDWIGSGIPCRNYVKFNFDTILIDKRAIYAELNFRPEYRFVKRDTIEIGVRELLEPIDDFNTATGPLIALEKIAVNDTVFSIDIVQHIQRIIEAPDSNFGFFITMSPENYDITRFKIIRNSHTLRVGYIMPPHER